MIKQLITRVKDWLFPASATCSHCEPKNPCLTHTPTGITADILFDGIHIGTAFNIEWQGECDCEHLIYASSLVFKFEPIDRVFMNSVVDGSSQRDAFNLKSKDGAIIATGVYLTDGEKPILTKWYGEETVWVNRATLNAGTYEEIATT